MIIAASSTPVETLPDFDVAIVGAGAVGVALATRLAGRVGRVALIEAGGPRAEPRVQSQFFAEDRIVEPGHPSTRLYRRRMLGGTTSVWGGRCIALDPDDLDANPTLTDWPISYDEMASWTADALQFLQAGSDNFSADALPPSARSDAVDGIVDPDLRVDRIERFSEPTNVWRKWGPQLVRSEDVTVIHDAACTNVETTADGARAVALDLRTGSGGRIKLRAKRIVLACGGLETPRLLLASRETRSRGLGNEQDLVGRFYITHLGGTLGTLQFRDPSADRCFDYGVTQEGVYARRLITLSAETRRHNNIGNIVFRPSIHSVADPSHADAILSAMAFAKKFVIPEYSRKLVFGAETNSFTRDLFLHGLNIAKGMPRLASFGFDWLRRRTFARRKLPSVFLLRPDSTYPIAFDTEQTPDPSNRVCIGESRDPFGVPRLVVRWKVSDGDVESITRAYRVLVSAMDRTGLGRVMLEPDIAFVVRDAVGPVGGHHIGTARMGADPKTSVTDKNGELWNTKGLFVAGSALFPTCGSANPTLSAVALAIRLADHLVRSQTECHEVMHAQSVHHA